MFLTGILFAFTLVCFGEADISSHSCAFHVLEWHKDGIAVVRPISEAAAVRITWFRTAAKVWVIWPRRIPNLRTSS